MILARLPLRCQIAIANWEAHKPVFWAGLSAHEALIVQMWVRRNACPC